MKLLAIFFLLQLSVTALAQNQADEFYDGMEMQAARDHMKYMGGGQSNYLVMAERFEYGVDDGDKSLAWDAQGWYGGDINRLWIKTEGHYDLDNSSREEFAIQALYSKAISGFWDVQMGLRHDFEMSARNYAVVGLQGLAPYWFELDGAIFLSDDGKVSSRFEMEYDLRFSQRLILQPSLQLDYGFSEDAEQGLGKGINEAQLGLRLRYELKREFAPYLGLSWQKYYGDTKGLRRAAGQSIEGLAVVAGLRFWY